MILAWSCLAASALADVTARIDRNSLVEGETITLVIQTNDPQQSLDGDLAPLQPDFAVLDRRTETQMSIVNGRQSAVMRLLLTLEPRRSGELTIPPLKFGASLTEPITLNVDPAPQPAAGEMPKVFIEVEVEPKDGPHYVHAQLRLTVRVLYLPELTEAAITPPEPTPAAVRLLDEVPFQAERGGQRYRVLERHYAVFPERSGPLTIPSMRLSGRLVERRSDNLWQPAVRGRRIEVASDPIELRVEPRPASYSGPNWQPARSLEVGQTLSSSDSLAVGEPITRTVIIDAVGLEENMIAEPRWPEVPGTRIYPDQPQGITRDDGRWVLGHKEFRYAVVPEQAGELVLPELTVTWWDTVNNREAVATLPEYRLQVNPSAAIPQRQPGGAVQPSQQSSGQPSVVPPAPAGPGEGYWRWATLLFAILWVATLAVLLRGRDRKAAPKAPATVENADEKALLAEVSAAGRRSDATALRRALSGWLRRFGPRSSDGSLLEFARDCGDPVLAEQLRALNAAGYAGGQDPELDGAVLVQSFEAWRRSRENAGRSRGAPVTELYAVAREVSRGRG